MTKSRQQLEFKKRKRSRRVVKDIVDYLDPKDIYELITRKSWDYKSLSKERFVVRDRAMMAFVYISLGRIAAVVGGYRYRWDNDWGEIVGKRFDKKTGESVNVYEGKAIKTGEHNDGIFLENITITEKFIDVRNMPVVKRSHKLIDNHGLQVTVRPKFIIPLKEGQYRKNKFGDQFIPFGYLILDYLTRFAPEEGKLFSFESSRAWQIINHVTGMYPHWFRAQGEHFYGHYIMTDYIQLSKFLKVVDPNSVKDYVGFSYASLLKDAEALMEFDWIPREVEKIQKRFTR